MATAVLRSHDVLNNRMHLDAFTPSPTKPRRRRSPKPAGASSPPPRAAAVASPPPKAAAVASPAPKTAALASPPVKGASSGRRSPPARPAARKQPSPTKEKPKQRLVMEEVRILKRGEEPPAPAPTPAPAPVVAAPVAKAAAAVDKRAPCSTGRIGPQAPTVVPTKKIVSAASAPDAARYAGPAFSAAAPEPSSLPMPAFFLRRAESEATRGLRCLLRIGELA
ncbi:hypothetical protein SEVIR_1G359100v4 [Setaria viridis]|uniref:Uncharacterized protein n=1 Tax=Setaria viridis TaxID=4556 RepID=A0A4U6WGR2_SETVI|nr:serine/arginine repetitive matrix protein 1 [Setaria viridis]TKW42058.1 hypothetical protein SEVIR_1G359100v2 [Setaria viridis]